MKSVQRNQKKSICKVEHFFRSVPCMACSRAQRDDVGSMRTGRQSHEDEKRSGSGRERAGDLRSRERRGRRPSPNRGEFEQEKREGTETEVGSRNEKCKGKNANWLAVRIQCAVRYATNQILTNSATWQSRGGAGVGCHRAEKVLCAWFLVRSA